MIDKVDNDLSVLLNKAKQYLLGFPQGFAPKGVRRKRPAGKDYERSGKRSNEETLI